MIISSKQLEAVMAAHLFTLSVALVLWPQKAVEWAPSLFQTPEIASDWFLPFFLTSSLHLGALWWNGRSLTNSTFLRFLAICLYLYFSMTIGLQLLTSGLVFQFITYNLLTTPLAMIVAMRLMDSIKVLRSGGYSNVK